MKALCLKGIKNLAMEERPAPQSGPDEVLLQVTHCAVCRTDAKMWANGHRDLVLPRIPGHEICGMLPDSRKRFVVWPGQSCGHCRFCRSGAENLCREMRITGFHSDGGFAEAVQVPKQSLLAVADDLPGDLACLAEPLACTLNALEQAQFKPEDRVLIYGAGPVGLLMGLAVRACGGKPAILEVNPQRLEQNHLFLERTGIAAAAPEDREFAIAVNAAPATETFEDGLSRLQTGGCFCLFSGLTDGASVPAALLNEIHYRQLRIVGAYGCTRMQMLRALDILSDHANTASLLIQERITLDEVPSVLPQILQGKVLKFIVEMV